jgi:hypothetical protein
VFIEIRVELVAFAVLDIMVVEKLKGGIVLAFDEVVLVGCDVERAVVVVGVDVCDATIVVVATGA